MNQSLKPIDISDYDDDGLLKVYKLSFNQPRISFTSVDRGILDEFDRKNCTIVLDWRGKKVRKSTQKTIPQCMSTVEQDPLVERPLQEYITGSSYKGTFNKLGFSGIGVYTYPHGTIYEGQFENGEFHGIGTLLYPNGQQLDGHWRKGKLIKWNYKYSDGLQHSKSWDYLDIIDRTYRTEINRDFNPPGQEQIDSKNTDTKYPAGTYHVDNEDYYDHKKRIIFSKDGKMRRIVNADEVDVICNRYRKESDNAVGYIPQFYEYWSTGRKKELKEMEKLFKRKKNVTIK